MNKLLIIGLFVMLVIPIVSATDTLNVTNIDSIKCVFDDSYCYTDTMEQKGEEILIISSIILIVVYLFTRRLL